ncbi:MAG: DVU_1555 family C-GCAxxG-C-C protein [Rhodomicrobium sp.]
MADESFRIAELLLDGHTCGQILVKLALEAQGRDDPDLVRAMAGLALGMGQGFNCGSLSGGCCLLGLYGGRSDENQPGQPRFDIMLEEFSGWFESEMTEKYGGINCEDIIHFDPALKQERCPGIILDCWLKAKEILAKHKVDIALPAQTSFEED